MKNLYILFSIFFAFSFASVEEEVILVNHKVYDRITKYQGYNTSFVMFYDPKCPYCQRTLPEFKQAAKIIKQRQIPVTFGTVDLAVIPDLGTKNNITKVPAIFYFNNGSEPIEISCHSYDEIVNFIMNAFHIHSVELTTVDEAMNLFLESENVGIFYGKVTDNEYKIFKEYLELHETVNVAFAYIFSNKLIKELELNESCKFTIVRKSDKENVYFYDNFTVSNLKKFIDIEIYPVLMPFQQRILQDFLKKQFPLLILMRKNDHKKSDKAQKVFEEACKSLRGKIQCATMNDKEEIDVTILDVAGLKSENLPQVIFLNYCCY